MAGTFAEYPEALDILDRMADGVSYPNALFINQLGDAARQIQVALGADPIDGNLPAGTASDWAGETTIQGWMERFLRMEVGTFTIELPLEQDASGTVTDFTVLYSNPLRFDKTNVNTIPHFCGVAFDQVAGPEGTEPQGGIAYQPLAHVNPYYSSATNRIVGFTLRNNEWGTEAYYRDMTLTGRYWAFEPEYH